MAAAIFVTSLMLRDYIGLMARLLPRLTGPFSTTSTIQICDWPLAPRPLPAAKSLGGCLSRASAMWSNAATALAAATLFYAWARRIGPARWLLVARCSCWRCLRNKPWRKPWRI